MGLSLQAAPDWYSCSALLLLQKSKKKYTLCQTIKFWQQEKKTILLLIILHYCGVFIPLIALKFKQSIWNQLITLLTQMFTALFLLF